MNSVNPKEVFLPLTAEEETELRAYLASRKPSEGVFKLERIIATLDMARTERDEALALAERRRQDRADALSVMSTDGLLSSEWVLRAGKAERERNEAQAKLKAVCFDCARCGKTYYSEVPLAPGETKKSTMDVCRSCDVELDMERAVEHKLELVDAVELAAKEAEKTRLGAVNDTWTAAVNAAATRIRALKARYG